MAGEVDKLMAKFLPWPDGHQYSYWRDRHTPFFGWANLPKDSETDIVVSIYEHEIGIEEEVYSAAILLPRAEADDLLRRLRLIAERMEQLLAARERDESSKP